MPRLIVVRGVDEGKQFELAGGAVTVGRHSANAVALHDTQVSRRHLEVRATAAGYELLDLGSGNGTLLNGQPVQVAPLRSGDTVTVGQTVLMFTAGRNEPTDAENELTQRVRLQPRPEQDLNSAIVRTVAADAGSQILSRPAAATDWLRNRLASLAALYETAEIISHILDVDQLLDTVMDLVFKSVSADHGCFMLRDEEGRLVPKAVRYRDGMNRQEELAVSRTVVEHVLKEKQGVLVSDVHTDDRFRAVESLHRHNIREAICVPMKGRREVVGVLFLDTQSTLKQAVKPRAGGEPVHRRPPPPRQRHRPPSGHRGRGEPLSRGARERRAAGGRRADHRGPVAPHQEHHAGRPVRGGHGSHRDEGETTRDLLGKGWKLVERNQGRIDDLILDMLSYSKEREPAVPSRPT